MFEIKTDGTPKFLISLMLAKIKLLRQEKLPFPGGKRWDGIPTYEKSSAMSEPRYSYIFNQRLEDSHYHTNMMSNGWGYASFRTTPKILKDAGKIDIPVLLLTSGSDALVDSKATINSHIVRRTPSSSYTKVLSMSYIMEPTRY